MAISAEPRDGHETLRLLLYAIKKPVCDLLENGLEDMGRGWGEM